MSDYSDILFDHRAHTHTSCVKEVVNSDMVILLVGSRFGGTAIPEAITEINQNAIENSSTKANSIKGFDGLSVTQVEVLKATEVEVPIFAFVDSKVYADHHLYTRNKGQEFSDKIIYPSIEKLETAQYIFRFIDFITHRFNNNAIIAYSTFSDIEDHLLKQWSMMFQRLLREERDKAAEVRRADAVFEQIEDLKAAVLQSIGSGSARDVARSVLKYRRLADFLNSLAVYNPNREAYDFDGSFDDLLQEYGVVGVEVMPERSSSLSRVILSFEDGSFARARVPMRRFQEFHVEWKTFSNLDKDTKKAVLEGVADSDTTGMPLIYKVSSQEIENRDPASLEGETSIGGTMHLADSAEATVISPWTEERIDELRRRWAAGETASRIAEALGGISRNAVIGKAHRLGLQPSSGQIAEGQTHNG